jgi:sulfide:quinone oxidoreductase
MLLRFKNDLPKAFRQVSSLHFQVQRNFENPLKKRKQTRRDLDKYDLVVVGGNLGGILTNHFDAEVHGHNSIMSVFDSNINQQYPIRVIYEQQRCTKTDYLLNAKLGINKYAATTEGVGCKEFLPAENAIVLKNGRKIKYEYLVIANGKLIN